MHAKVIHADELRYGAIAYEWNGMVAVVEKHADRFKEPEFSSLVPGEEPERTMYFIGAWSTSGEIAMYSDGTIVVHQYTATLVTEHYLFIDTDIDTIVARMDVMVS